MYLRRATPSDTQAIQALTGDALARILTQVRATNDWLPALSFVALDADGRIVGHVTGTRGYVGTGPAVALTPPAVHPDHQGRGVGTALLHSVLGAADALGEPLAAITGIPTGYYARFGFRPAREHAITAPVPEWEPYFQVRPLSAYTTSLHGRFAYPEPFTRS